MRLATVIHRTWRQQHALPTTKINRSSPVTKTPKNIKTLDGEGEDGEEADRSLDTWDDFSSRYRRETAESYNQTPQSSGTSRPNNTTYTVFQRKMTPDADRRQSIAPGSFGAVLSWPLQSPPLLVFF